MNQQDIPPTERVIVIESVREDGRRFRPSDWIERLSGTLAEFGVDRRLRYCSSVYPEMVGGHKCLVIEQTLEQINPDAFRFILRFAADNRLRLHYGTRDDHGLPTGEPGGNGEVHRTPNAA